VKPFRAPSQDAETGQAIRDEIERRVGERPL
jgi:hypothetical protein